MKYIRDLAKILLFLAIFYLPLAWFTISHNLQHLNESRDKMIQQNLQKSVQDLREILESSDLLEVCSFLKAQQKGGVIAGYTLRGEEVSCHFPDGLENMPPDLRENESQDFLVRGVPLTYWHSKTGHTEWALAVAKPLRLSLFSYLRSERAVREAFVADFFLVVYSLCVFLMLAVLILTKSIQNGFRSRGQDPHWLKILNLIFAPLQLDDLALLQRATRASRQFVSELKRDRDLLETSLEESIREEIQRLHRQIPYHFQGVVAKVDINGFSKVIGQGRASQARSLVDSLEEFGCESLRRYEGLFEKTVGDEIVAVFKSQDGVLMATAFVRDLMMQFSSVKFQLGEECRQFTLKGAISSSDLVFRKRRSGYGFDGEALVKTTRLLETVTLKDRNILSCEASMAEALSSLAPDVFERRTFDFKNMPSQEGCWISSFLPVSKAFTSDPQLLKYFRSNDDLIFLLSKATEEKNTTVQRQLLHHLLSVRVRQGEPKLIDAWKKLVLRFQEEASHRSESRTFLSLAVKLAENLIPGHLWSEECTQTLLQIPLNIEDRINSSIIEVLIEKGTSDSALEIEGELSSLGHSQSFRSRGNILMAKALRNLDDEVLEDLNQMLQSANPFERNTGLFCVCQIILFYRSRNPAEMEIHPSYAEVLRRLQNWKKSKVEISDRLQGFLDQVV